VYRAEYRRSDHKAGANSKTAQLIRHMLYHIVLEKCVATCFEQLRGLMFL
jgi:hypothetical protein